MKKITFLFVLILVGLVSSISAQTTIADFDGADLVFEGWNGSGFAAIENPHSEGINTSANVAEFTHAGNDWWSGLASTLALSSPIDFATTPYLKMKVYADEPIQIVFKMEQFDNGDINSEVWYKLEESETNQWTELFFDFSKTTHTTLDKIVLFIDPGNAYSSEGKKYYFDDIVATNVAVDGKYSLTPVNTATDVPVLSEMNTQTNIGVRLIDNTELTDQTDLSTVLTLKKTDANGEDVPFTATVNDTKTGLTIKPDEMLESNTTYWYGVKDNVVEYYISEDPLVGAQATFTTGEGFPTVYTINDFDGINKCSVVESMGDPASTINTTAADPSGASNQVLQFDKGSSWGGWERMHFEFTYPIEVVDGKAAFKVRVYSPRAGGILLKIADKKEADGDDAKKAEKWADVTEANTWQTLYYEFENLEEANYNHLFIYPEGGNGDANTYYFDDLNGPETPQPPLVVDYYPLTDATEVNQFGSLSITSNYIFADTDGSDITDLTGKVALKKGSSTGEDVAFIATLSEDKKQIKFMPTELLDINSSYWFGVVDNMLSLAATGDGVTGMSSSFTTIQTAPEMAMYHDFNGNSLVALAEPMGDPAGILMLDTLDPADANNTVAQWNKGDTWWGWERIHFELNTPVILTGDMIFSIKVYSPKTTYVRLKLADQKDESGQTFIEVDADVTKVDEWQTLYFDLSAIDDAVDYQHLFIFIDGGTEEGVDEANTYYVDDIQGAVLEAPTAIGDETEVNGVRISPNPATDFIRISNADANQMVEIYNTAGVKVKDQTVNSGVVSIDDLNAGLYFVKVGDNVTKLIKR